MKLETTHSNARVLAEENVYLQSDTMDFFNVSTTMVHPAKV